MGHRYVLHRNGINAVARGIPFYSGTGAGADKNNECCTRSAYCSCILSQGMSGSIVGVEKRESESNDWAREGETEKEGGRKREREARFMRGGGVGGVGTFCSRC